MALTAAPARTLLSLALLGAILLPAPCAAADDWAQCTSQTDDGARLKCYDTLNAARQAENQAAPQTPPPPTVSRSYLTRSWDLDNMDDDLLGDDQSPLRPHRASYLIARHTNEPNLLPYSPTHPAPATPAAIETTELKFQLSQKAKILNSRSTHFLGVTSFRLWGAYTQQSSWQAFNTEQSSPFRETNYEPELIATFGTGHEYGMKLINLGWVHQSNGRDSAASRSWNRFYVQGGWETETLSALVRGWWRIPENTAHDNNPDIENYIGRAEIALRWAPLNSRQVIDMILRNNLRSHQNHSFMQLDWATPITLNQSAKLHVQLTSGYGESLIDYNYRQTTIGLGVSFRDW
jgi:phospholipase A1